MDRREEKGHPRKERLRKAQTGKDLKPAEKAVKNQMPRHLVEHWIDLLSRKQRFDEDAQWNFPAGIEAQTGQLRIGSLNLDLKNAPLEDVAKVAAKLGKLTLDIMPFLELRSLLESPQGPQARLQDDKEPYDLEMLRSRGLGDLANKLESEIQAEEEPTEEKPEGEAAENTKAQEPPSTRSEARKPDTSKEVDDQP